MVLLSYSYMVLLSYESDSRDLGIRIQLTIQAYYSFYYIVLSTGSLYLLHIIIGIIADPPRR